MSLALFETAAGYALFKVLDKAVTADEAKVHTYFSTPEKAAQAVKLLAFSKFADTAAAVAGASAICDGKLDKSLRKFLQTSLVDASVKGKLAVAEAKLGGLIKEKLPAIVCVHDTAVEELMRGIRSQIDTLLSGISAADSRAMKLGLSHSLGRYKLKMSPDKVDTMIIQAISLLDELDKELNTYAMRVREWYGWHFPEMGKIVVENIMYAKCVKVMGVRKNAPTTDLSTVMPEEIEKEVKAAAEVSMGTEVSEEDITNVVHLCDQVISISEYRTSLYDYLKNRMQAIAPNLTVMVGELVGARLIAHAGSLLNLAKHPASTVQILGAEKALFRALKTKHDTPKYGLIYHASLVGQAGAKNKGKVSRVLANKSALACRVDALGDAEGPTEAVHYRENVENRLRVLEGGKAHALSGTGKGKAAEAKYTKPVTAAKTYNADADVALGKEGKEEKVEASGEDKKKKKDKKRKGEEEAAAAVEAPVAAAAAGTKKAKTEAVAEVVAADGEGDKKKKKKKDKKKEAEE